MKKKTKKYFDKVIEGINNIEIEKMRKIKHYTINEISHETISKILFLVWNFAIFHCMSKSESDNEKKIVSQKEKDSS